MSRDNLVVFNIDPEVTSTAICHGERDLDPPLLANDKKMEACRISSSQEGQVSDSFLFVAYERDSTSGLLSNKSNCHQCNYGRKKSAWEASSQGAFCWLTAVALAAIQDKGFKLVEHLPYSPDLVLWGFYQFPKLKK